MNANEIAFGIEFETTLPNSDTTPIGPYHHGPPRVQPSSNSRARLAL
jgi:hypothetical protein